MNDIKKAIEILKKGGIVIYPTDTAFGVGCRIDNIESIKKLFRIRQRPHDKAVPVLVNSFAMAKKYWASPLPDIVRHLTTKHWPGALTIVYTAKKELVSPIVRGYGDTIGLRMPDHKIPLKLIQGVGVPILGPSANFSGDKTPYSLDYLNPDFVKLVDFVLAGKCKTKIASTVLDVAISPPKTLRQGSVKL
ncbi:threonylcarbamoyl-AMP synthase [Candidatus Gottesmanbacteria bacterium]|nr:threonylcarbamoyl-AMP synthase [Candidatus Gottesmanbacteria bacterium]